MIGSVKTCPSLFEKINTILKKNISAKKFIERGAKALREVVRAYGPFRSSMNVLLEEIGKEEEIASMPEEVYKCIRLFFKFNKCFSTNLDQVMLSLEKDLLASWEAVQMDIKTVGAQRQKLLKKMGRVEELQKDYQKFKKPMVSSFEVVHEK